MTRETSFDHRIVRYEEIHSIQPGDFEVLVNAAYIEGSCSVLDCGCGYGAVTREILRATEQSRATRSLDLFVDLIDESLVQLQRAKQELQQWRSAVGVKLRFINGTFPQDLPLDSPKYDAVFCKMVLHEISPGGQLPFVSSAYDSLKEGGRFVFWDVCLSPDVAEFYRAVVRAKDRLAGYDTMAQRRNFLTEGNIRELFAASPFGKVEFVKNIEYRFDTRKRLLPEFQGDVSKFEEWQAFVRESSKSVSSLVLEKLNYHDDGETICFDIRKIIARAIRSSITAS